jgi:signal transduction histidine kinase
MQVEIVLAALVLVIAALVAADLLRRTGDAPHEHTDRSAHAAKQEIFPASRARTTTFAQLAATGGRAALAPGAGPAEVRSPAADGRQPAEAEVAMPRQASPGAQKYWQVSIRLWLPAAISAVSAALVTIEAIRAASAFQSASFHSDISSMRDGPLVSGLVACLFAAAVLAAGLWCVVFLIRSVLGPLRQLRVAAVELAEVRLPDALRHIGQSGRGGRPLEVRAIGVSSPDEIGEIARAFDQVQREVVRLAVDEAGLHSRLDEMFVDLGHRGQALVERQIRLIDDLGHGEQDGGRLASLLKMDHIAARMRRQAQNLLVLAGHEPPGHWNQPVTLADVMRAAISEIEQYERVSFSAQAGIAVAGPAVNDVVHLIAELAENATSVSAADTPVDISGRPLASGGVLIEITDEGIGMTPDQMERANWQLDHPLSADITAWRSMGFLVVGSLAARHGARVRLQSAPSGGLAAQVWLPDAIIVVPDTTLSSGPGGIDGFRSRPGAHGTAAPGWHAGTEPGRAPALRETGGARALSPAPVMADLDITAGQRRIPASGPDAEQNLAEGGPAPSPATDEGHQLPIYEAVESDWFRNHGKVLGGIAAPRGGWAPPADAGWDAARAVTAPSTGGLSTAGLPVRVPRENLVPGGISSPNPAPPTSARSATAARDRLAGFRRGVSEGRAALDPRREDETS